MSERQSGEIVDFHLSAFDTDLAIVTAYDTTGTPRTPVEIFYARHRAYVNYAEAREHQLPLDHPLVKRVLGATAISQTPELVSA